MTTKMLTLDPLFPDGAPAVGTRLTVSVDRDVAIVGSGIVARKSAARSYTVDRDGTFPTIAVTPNDDASLQDWSKGYALIIEAEATPAGGVTGGPWTVVITSLDDATLSLSDLDVANVVGLPPNISLSDTMARLSTVEGEAADAVTTSQTAQTDAANALTVAQAANEWANQHGNIVSASISSGDLIFTLDDTPTTTLNAGAVPTASVTDPAVAAVIGDTQTKAALDGAYAPTTDDATTASGKAVNVNYLPKYLLTKNSMQVADIEYVTVRAVDHIDLASSDMSGEFTDMLTYAQTNGMRVALQEGDYYLANVAIPRWSNIDTSAPYGTLYPAAGPGGSRGRVKIHRIGDGSKPALYTPVQASATSTVGGSGISLRNVTIVDDTAVTDGAPLMQLGEWFECQMNRVFFYNAKGTALAINSASNSQFDDVQMQFCGSIAQACLVIGGDIYGNSVATNTIDFNRLRIERQWNAAIEIGSFTSWSAAAVEFVRFLQPHLESPSPAAGGTPTDYYNRSGLMRIGASQGIDIIAPFIYASIGGAISHEAPSVDAGTNLYRGDSGGVSVVGGTLLGRIPSANSESTGVSARDPYLVHLVKGNGFDLRGTKLVGAASYGAQIESGYGPDVNIEPAVNQQGFTQASGTVGRLPRVNDLRSTYSPVAIAEGSGSTGATTSLSAGSDSKAGTVTVTTAAAGSLALKVNIPAPGTTPAKPRSVTITPMTSAAASVGPYLGYVTNVGFQIKTNTNVATGTTYTWSYAISW